MIPPWKTQLSCLQNHSLVRTKFVWLCLHGEALTAFSLFGLFVLRNPCIPRTQDCARGEAGVRSEDSRFDALILIQKLCIKRGRGHISVFGVFQEAEPDPCEYTGCRHCNFPLGSLWGPALLFCLSLLWLFLKQTSSFNTTGLHI